jgi:hypothetical protein
MSMRFLLLLLIVLLVFSIGCRRTAVAPGGGAPPAAVQESFTAADMREAVLKGCLDAGWQAAEIDANTIEATIVVRGKHTAVVSIPYTAQTYSINYKSSTNMAYKGKSDGGVAIHGAYNRWVNNLHAAIQKQIAQKKTAKAT